MSKNRNKHNAIHREQFTQRELRRKGAEPTDLEVAWAERRADFECSIAPRAIADRGVSSRYAGGPQMRSQQFEKTLVLERA